MSKFTFIMLAQNENQTQAYLLHRRVPSADRMLLLQYTGSVN